MSVLDSVADGSGLVGRTRPTRDPDTGRSYRQPSRRTREVTAYLHRAKPRHDWEAGMGVAGWLNAAQARARREKRARDVSAPEGLVPSDVAFVGQVVEHEGANLWVDLLDDDGVHELARFEVTEFPVEMRNAVLGGQPFRAEPGLGPAGSQAVFRLVEARNLTDDERADRNAEAALLIRGLRRQAG